MWWPASVDQALGVSVWASLPMMIVSTPRPADLHW
jgi:hypothetical protein